MLTLLEILTHHSLVSLPLDPADEAAKTTIRGKAYEKYFAILNLELAADASSQLSDECKSKFKFDINSLWHSRLTFCADVENWIPFITFWAYDFALYHMEHILTCSRKVVSGLHRWFRRHPQHPPVHILER